MEAVCHESLTLSVLGGCSLSICKEEDGTGSTPHYATIKVVPHIMQPSKCYPHYATIKLLPHIMQPSKCYPTLGNHQSATPHYATIKVLPHILQPSMCYPTLCNHQSATPHYATIKVLPHIMQPSKWCLTNSSEGGIFYNAINGIKDASTLVKLQKNINMIRTLFVNIPTSMWVGGGNSYAVCVVVWIV